MQPGRVKELNRKPITSGPVVYWMSRDQRVSDNWALSYAQHLAKTHSVPLAVVFCLRTTFGYSTHRLLDFMLKGLDDVQAKLSLLRIPFYFLLGDPVERIPEFIQRHSVGALVSDFSPLRYNREWKNKICNGIGISCIEVDAHNIVPVWEASQKQEYAAYTIRPKIHRLLSLYQGLPPAVTKNTSPWNHSVPSFEWKSVLSKIGHDRTVLPVSGIDPGEKAAFDALENFAVKRIDRYASHKNDPNEVAQSGLSPYLHFGHISSARIFSRLGGFSPNTESFLEELVVRKELSDNYCLYNHSYDTPDGFPDWARKSLEKHAGDKREYLYTAEVFESAKTHDDLWNACQTQMVKTGTMHGYLRMYWAKKILEWSPTVEQAQKTAIYLNDTYFLDGRDPNGYAGIAWSMGGVHDRPWFERPVFGQIRYMNRNGADRKFNTHSFIASQVKNNPPVNLRTTR